MNLMALLRPLVALARLQGIQAEELAAMYQDMEGNQKYYDRVLALVSRIPERVN